jgi:RNA polymerase sigma-70 factor (ECF subfamily)
MGRTLPGISLSNIFTNSRREVGAAVSRSEDADLFEGFLAGDDAAAVRLFNKFNPRLFLYCSKVLGDPDQAEDITQALWERVIALRSKPHEVHNPGSFLFRIARNLCINQMKSRHRSVPFDSIAESAHPSAQMPGASDLEELVLSSLDALRFEEREILILNAYCGYRFEEIAEMMGISSGAIWTRASRARAHLRNVIVGLVGSSDGPSGSANGSGSGNPKEERR